jgi:hypothetical protein
MVALCLLTVVGAGCTDPDPSSNRVDRTSEAAEAPTGGNDAPDLEALLPDQLGGTSLEKASTVGDHILDEDPWSREMLAFLEGVGKTRTQLRFAQVWVPEEEKVQLDAGAFQVPGVDGSALRQALIDSSRPTSPELTTSTATVAGKHVATVLYPDGRPTLYLYVHDDVVFFIGTADETLASDYLDSLP